MLERFENSARVLEICKTVRRQNRDPHLLFSQVGERVGLVPESTIRAAFCNIWAQSKPRESSQLVEVIRAITPDLIPVSSE